jgi:hypothetical protein
MSSRLDAEDIATSFYPYFNFTRAFFALLRQDISWGVCRKNTQNVVCLCQSSYDKIGQFTKNPGQGQKMSFAFALEDATQADCLYHLPVSTC